MVSKTHILFTVVSNKGSAKIITEVNIFLKPVANLFSSSPVVHFYDD